MRNEFRHNLKITHEMAEKLDKYADKMAVSRNSLICMIISEWFEQQETKERLMSPESLSVVVSALVSSGLIGSLPDVSKNSDSFSNMFFEVKE